MRAADGAAHRRTICSGTRPRRSAPLTAQHAPTCCAGSLHEAVGFIPASRCTDWPAWSWSGPQSCVRWQLHATLTPMLRRTISMPCVLEQKAGGGPRALTAVRKWGRKHADAERPASSTRLPCPDVRSQGSAPGSGVRGRPAQHCSAKTSCRPGKGTGQRQHQCGPEPVEGDAEERGYKINSCRVSKFWAAGRGRRSAGQPNVTGKAEGQRPRDRGK
ncbi:hypothetical protein BC628DRAFT_946840 [Trametes gibbosa]|nr:hypothetical protein BC628DRAFT_946840 [Trametes gibbosa]